MGAETRWVEKVRVEKMWHSVVDLACSARQLCHHVMSCDHKLGIPKSEKDQTLLIVLVIVPRHPHCYSLHPSAFHVPLIAHKL